MKKIAVFGGSFDPVHKAHIEIACLAMKEFSLENIFFVPAWTAPHKKGHFASPKQRLEMLEIALSKFPEFEISLYEIGQKEKIFSYQTLDHFKETYPNDEIFMIIGSDSLNDLPAWKNIDYLAKKYRFIAAPRSGALADQNAKYLDRCLFIDRTFENISSTQIRNLISAGDIKAKDYLNEEVYEYIKQNGLYAYKA
ncbi:MAG: nicotinate-nucleotide adenylyltransferase [Elusimicrobiota bacterium]|jgi:nicotinate-nucleotide adenylyltransferase|nr:nicotinate-nucleotide adenylyltransferase [Elusimicrobiota bacterium]